MLNDLVYSYDWHNQFPHRSQTHILTEGRWGKEILRNPCTSPSTQAPTPPPSSSCCCFIGIYAEYSQISFSPKGGGNQTLNISARIFLRIENQFKRNFNSLRSTKHPCGAGSAAKIPDGDFDLKHNHCPPQILPFLTPTCALSNQTPVP